MSEPNELRHCGTDTPEDAAVWLSLIAGWSVTAVLRDKREFERAAAHLENRMAKVKAVLGGHHECQACDLAAEIREDE